MIPSETKALQLDAKCEIIKFSLQKFYSMPLVTFFINKVRPCAFFSMFLVTFFSPNLRGRAEKKQYAQRKKNTDRQMTYRTYCVEPSHSFVYFLPNNDRVKQRPVATEVWLFLVLDLSSRAKNVLESSTETFINIANAFDNSSCRDRSLDGKLDRGLDSRPNKYPDVFVKARPHYYQQSLRSMILIERILAFGTRLLPPNSRKRALRCFQRLWRMCMNGEHHAF